MPMDDRGPFAFGGFGGPSAPAITLKLELDEGQVAHVTSLAELARKTGVTISLPGVTLQPSREREADAIEAERSRAKAQEARDRQEGLRDLGTFLQVLQAGAAAAAQALKAIPGLQPPEGA